MAYNEQDPSRLYRIAYEAYSKFATNISRCSSLEEVGIVSKRHLKYLLNFHIIRVAMEQDERFLFFSLKKNESWYDFKNKTELFPFEKELYERDIPIKTSDIPPAFIEGTMEQKDLKNPVLWAWSLKKNNRKVIVSLLSDDQKPFASGDIDILKLTADAFEAKFQELFLKKQLDRKNRSLSKALDTIQLQNEKIQKIVDNQKQIIEERTQEILSQNEKLLRISALNSHNVREPLSRIQGIIQLFDVLDDKTCREELIPKLKISADEMDKVLQEVILMASKELAELKAKKL
ncbi:histidine kinase [Salegentibacter chungangensis]|uniref:Histidine kinase n=1 Tax=Salegentibacter chungangensis TaxID=1335724 RepID=A0ABW3NRB4_9FLAO